MRQIRASLGQSIPETAILLGVVVAAVLTIQTYARRSLQDRLSDAVRQQPQTPGGVPVPMQYEPYYLEGPGPATVVSNARVRVTTAATAVVTPGQVHAAVRSDVARDNGAFQDEYPPR